jgi:hypothetical protein
VTGPEDTMRICRELFMPKAWGTRVCGLWERARATLEERNEK